MWYETLNSMHRKKIKRWKKEAQKTTVGCPGIEDGIFAKVNRKVSSIRRSSSAYDS